MRSVARLLRRKRVGHSGAQQTPQRVGAGVALLDDRGQVLLVRRRDNTRWDLPGGGVEPGEEVEAAARRELHEETGLGAGPLTLLGVFSGEAHRHVYPGGNVVAWVTVLYRAEPSTGAARAGDDAAEVRWWPLAALPEDVSAATRAYFAALPSFPRGAT